MANLSGLYKNLIVFALILGTLAVTGKGYADEVDEMLEDADYTETASVDAANISYINDIEILGANIIKPEYIMSKMSLKKGDLYDKDVMQQDLKAIYRMGYFTERMKAIPVKNSNGTISLKIIVEENIPVTNFTI